MASDLVQALNRLTGHKQLHLLTMLPWSEVVPQRALLRSDKAWCPICYEEQRTNCCRMYEPLLWTLNVVEVCPIHQQPLHNMCPHCNQSNLPLSWRARVGHCSKCGKWLGDQSRSVLNNEQPSQKADWSRWVANAVGEMITSASNLPQKISRDRVAKGFTKCVHLLTDGNVAEFARLVQTPRNTVWLWCNGKSLPQLDALLKLCFCLKISPLSLLTQEELDIDDQAVRALPKFPTKHRSNSKLTDLNQVGSQLEAVLLDHRLPPPSLEATARALGYHRETIYRNFKDVCRAISARYDQYEQFRYLSSIEECCEEVRRVVLQLHEEGVYPSEACVSQRLTKPGHLRYKQVRAALQETRKSLSLRK